MRLIALLFPKFPSIGLYHYRYQENGSSSRIHLRVEPNKSGVLLINANQVLFLNPAATLMSYLILEKIPQSQAIKHISNIFKTNSEQVKLDFSNFTEQLSKIINHKNLCLVHDFDLDILQPFQNTPTAPYRIDLALTYRCNNNCAHCYNETNRAVKEISFKKWIQIIDKIKCIGVPHIVFTGGEPTLSPHLIELIAYAESKELITGLNTNGCKLSDSSYLDQLINAGLDHVQITIESHDHRIHDDIVGHAGAWEQTVRGIKNSLQKNLYVMTNTTLLIKNSLFLEETLDFLSSLEVPTIGINALIYAGRGKSVGSGLPENTLHPLLEMAINKTIQAKQRLIWYTPTQYCNFNPVDMSLGVKGCTAALHNVCIEPDGSVLPCQSYYQPLGNILTDPWDTIWNHPLAESLRNRDHLPEKCVECTIKTECGGGCPLVFRDG